MDDRDVDDKEHPQVGQTLTRRTALAGAASIGTGAVLLGAGAVPALAGGAPVTAAQRGAAPAMTFVLSHEQFPVPQLVEYGAAAERAGFEGIWISDRFQFFAPHPQPGHDRRPASQRVVVLCQL